MGSFTHILQVEPLRLCLWRKHKEFISQPKVMARYNIKWDPFGVCNLASRPWDAIANRSAPYLRCVYHHHAGDAGGEGVLAQAV